MENCYLASGMSIEDVSGRLHSICSPLGKRENRALEDTIGGCSKSFKNGVLHLLEGR